MADQTPALDALRAEMNPQQRANFDKMLNHQPRLKKMFNATIKPASEAWNSQPGIRARLAAMGAASAGRTALGATGRAIGTASTATYNAAMNPRQTLDNATDLGGRALSATGHGIAAGTKATGRGIAAGTKATGRSIANSTVGRWVSDTWSRATAAAEAGRRAFNQDRAGQGAGNTAAQDRLDLSDRAAAVVSAHTPEEQATATAALLTQIQAQIDKNNAGFGTAQAPAAQAVQTSAATGPQQGTAQGTAQGAQQGERAQQPDLKKSNGGVQR